MTISPDQQGDRDRCPVCSAAPDEDHGPHPLWCQEETIAQHDDGKRYHCGDSEVYETCYDNLGDLYRASMREHGRCVSKVYVDVEGKPPRPVGWVFVKRRPFDDNDGSTYLAETWVTVHTAPPSRTIEYHYAEGSA